VRKWKFYGLKYNNLSLGHMLSDMFHTNRLHTELDYGAFHLSNMEIGLTAGVTGQQRVLAPPWHLIPPLIYS
jgi:hypothetical protein